MRKTEKQSSAKAPVSPGEMIEITGIVIPVEWDENANPTLFALSAYDEQEYIMDNFTALCDFPQKILRKTIKVYGTMGKIIKKRKKITITRYDVLEEDFLENSL